MEERRLETAARPEAMGFLRERIKEMIDLAVTTPEGIHLPQLSGFRPDHDRLSRVSARIIRGLFYRESCYPVPDGYGVTATIRQIGFEPENDLRIHKYFTSVPLVIRRCIQDGTFIYRYSKFPEDNDATAWVGIFYRLPIWLLGLTSPQSEASPLPHMSKN